MLTAGLVCLAAALQPPTGKLNWIDTLIGPGPAAEKGDLATVSYRGWLPSGAEFDKTEGRGPAAFVLGEGQVIKGLEQGVEGMRTGGIRVLSVPPDLGYKDAGAASPKGETLIFELKLLRVDKKGAKRVVEIEEQASGEGPQAKDGDTLEVHYTGSFLDGTKFDSSRDRNQPLSVQLGKGRVIKGFEQGLSGMRVGGKRKVTIPYELAYGEAGRPPVIPPRSTLVFELELVGIK